MPWRTQRQVQRRCGRAQARGDGALVSAEWLYDSVSDCERKPVGAYQERYAS